METWPGIQIDAGKSSLRMYDVTADHPGLRGLADVVRAVGPITRAVRNYLRYARFGLL